MVREHESHAWKQCLNWVLIKFHPVMCSQDDSYQALGLSEQEREVIMLCAQVLCWVGCTLTLFCHADIDRKNIHACASSSK